MCIHSDNSVLSFTLFLKLSQLSNRNSGAMPHGNSKSDSTFIPKWLPPKAMGREVELFLTEVSENSATGNGKKKVEG